MKRKAMVLALVLALAVLSVGSAMAAQGTFTVTITQVGSNSFGFYTFTATDTAVGGFGTVGFFIVADVAGTMQKATYAAALTAYSTGGKAVIYADPVTTACWQVWASN